MTGRDDLLDAVRSNLEFLLALIPEDGRITLLPDKHGSAAYEYGLALSVLGLAAQVFRDRDPALADRSAVAAARVFDCSARAFRPGSEEDRAMLLAGFRRAYSAIERHRSLTSLE